MSPKNGMRPIHPVEILRKEFSERDLFECLAHEVESDGITEEMARWLGRILGTSPEFWVNLQRAYDERTKGTNR